MEGEIQKSVAWPKAILALAMILVAGIIVLALLRDRIVNPPQWQVSVVGQGKIAYQPDIANVTLGVQIDKVAKADEALSQLNDKANKIITAVKAVGIPAEDIQTQNYSLYPQYDYINNSSSLSGYNANEQLLIKVRDISQDNSKLSKVIAEASKAGANQVTGVSFDISTLNDLKQQARFLAIADAKQKANKLADSAGVRLGKVIGWWENLIQAPGVSGPMTYGGEGKGGAGGIVSPTVPSGNQELIMEINLNYQVK